MRTGLILATTTAILFAGQALAVTPTRVRGTIASVNGDNVVVDLRGGGTETVALDPATKYAGVVKSDITDLKSGDFIGTATKGPKSFMVALEVVIFPNSMRGTGEGQYPWDRIGDTTTGGGATGSTMTNGTASTMTNGTVSSEAAHQVASATSSTMTNGTVSESGSGPTRTITVTYHGQSQKVIVPPTAPIVRFQPAGKSIVEKGSSAFIVATGDAGHLTAKFVAIGQDGVVPPM